MREVVDFLTAPLFRKTISFLLLYQLYSMENAEKPVDPVIVQVLVDALSIEEDEVVPSALLIEDLGAESIDGLDINFRLQRAAGIQIGTRSFLQKLVGDQFGPMDPEQFPPEEWSTPEGTVARLEEIVSRHSADSKQLRQQLLEERKGHDDDRFARRSE